MQESKFTVFSMASLSLPPSKHRWISAVSILSTLPSSVGSSTQTAVICGDRKGTVHVYHCRLEHSQAEESSTSYMEPVLSLRLHGANGVTSIVIHRDCVYTAGRDGCCRRFSFGSDGFLNKLSLFKVCW